MTSEAQESQLNTFS